MSGSEHAIDTTIVREWAKAQIRPWTDRVLNGFSEFCDRINTTSYSIFIYDFDQIGVAVRPKPPSMVLTLPHGEHMYSIRAREYHEFFSDLGFLTDNIFSVALDVADEAPDNTDYPVFSFQRSVGYLNILLPDLEFIEKDFYQSEWRDDRPFASKRTHAIFVGSTTGRPNFTMDDVSEGRVPRIDSARYFRQSPDVTFRLPRIVQCASPEVEAALRQEGLGGDLVSWKAQLESKFVISLDGNGATCSRVYLALLSNSVLIKYKSENELFYFPYLEPFLHFLPAVDNADVLKYIDAEKRHPGGFSEVASASRDFARRFLSKTILKIYVEILLRDFSKLV